MTQPDRNNSDDDFQDVLRRLDQEAGGGRPDEPERSAGLGQPPPAPEPQRGYVVRLPLGGVRAVWALLALNVAIFVIPLLLDLAGLRLSGVPISDYIAAWGAKSNDAIRRQGEYYRLLTSMFLHGNLLHIAFNAYALYALGPEAERIYGTPRFLAAYFLAGLSGGIASYTFSPYDSVGASGAIFGLIGALGAFYYSSRELFGDIARRQLGSLITVVMINLFIGFSVPRIDNYAHIGGLLGGVLAGWLLAPRFVLDERRYPPQIAPRSLPQAWSGALAFLLVLAFLALTITPPL